MLSQYFEQIEILTLNIFLGAIFLLIWLAIKDVLTQGNVPALGRFVVWLVLFLGCFGFIAKGFIQVFWQEIG